jgi:hypothetical protein
MMRTAVLLVAVLLVAGCSKPAQIKGDEAPNPTISADDLGAARGLVVDSEQMPLAGVKIRLIGNPANATSDAHGRFVFSDLPPKLWLMVATKEGYFERQTGLEIQSGQTTNITISLDAFPPPTPYVDASYTLDGAIRGGYAYRVAGTRGNSSGNPSTIYPDALRTKNSDYLHPQSGDWTAILIEAEWEPNSDFSRALALELTVPEKINDQGSWTLQYKLWGDGGSSPLRWRLDRTTYDSWREANPRFFPVLDRGIMFTVKADAPADNSVGLFPDQRFTLYGTIAYNAPLDEGYTRLPPS